MASVADIVENDDDWLTAIGRVHAEGVADEVVHKGEKSVFQFTDDYCDYWYWDLIFLLRQYE